MMHGWGTFGGGGIGGVPFGIGGMRRQQQRFEETYHCYSVAFADKPHLEKGDKILLPPSAFDVLARLQVDYPMLFRLTAMNSTDATIPNKSTHSGVLEFTAEEGCVYIPHWMMQNLLIEEGSLITVTNVSLPKATFVKLQPQSVDFLEISNPRAVLEHALRNFSCVTIHDTIQIPYNNKHFHFTLNDVQPSPAACIIETDCNVDFDPPVGYVEPDYKKLQQQQQSEQTSGSQSASLSRRSSDCPSPATTVSSAAAGIDDDTKNLNNNTKPRGIRIVDGQIIRPDDNANSSNTVVLSSSDMIADRTGSTGIQRNAAIPDVAPQVHYWAINAGDGNRLDGKTITTPLKDAATGNVLDIRQIRAEAAAKRAAELEAAALASIPITTGRTIATGEKVDITGTTTPSTSTSNTTTAATAQRKTRVGNKYSKLKGSSTAFIGSANQMK